MPDATTSPENMFNLKASFKHLLLTVTTKNIMNLEKILRAVTKYLHSKYF